MKRFIFLAVLMMAMTLLAQDQRDVTGRGVRYRAGATLSLDTTSYLKDEDAAWAVNSAQFKRLSLIQCGIATNFNHLTVTNFFSVPFAAPPVVVVTGATNDVPYLVSVTTTNIIIGAIQTNTSLRWIALPGNTIQSSAAAPGTGGTAPSSPAVPNQ